MSNHCEELPIALCALICILIETVFFLVTLVKVGKQTTELGVRSQYVETLSSMNDCGDEFTNFPLGHVRSSEGAVINADKSLAYVRICLFASLLSCGCSIVLGFCRADVVDDFKKVL